MKSTGKKPTLDELGRDLLQVSTFRKTLSLVMPFIYVGAYFYCAFQGLWILLALLCIMLLTFFTYTSISHDLVHQTLGLPSRWNEILLSLVEILCLRSGHAYRAVHLHHHRRFPHEDDVEGSAARMTFFRAFLEGPLYIPKIVIWAWKHVPQKRKWLMGEGMVSVSFIVFSCWAYPSTAVPLVYAGLVIGGSWFYPLFTAYFPHDAQGKDEWFQTRVFRGKMISTLFLRHNYHLEHHLYPSVPHHQWPALARRLDPYLARRGIQPFIGKWKIME